MVALVDADWLRYRFPMATGEGSGLAAEELEDAIAALSAIRVCVECTGFGRRRWPANRVLSALSAGT